MNEHLSKSSNIKIINLIDLLFFTEPVYLLRERWKESHQKFMDVSMDSIKGTEESVIPLLKLKCYTRFRNRVWEPEKSWNRLPKPLVKLGKKVSQLLRYLRLFTVDTGEGTQT